MNDLFRQRWIRGRLVTVLAAVLLPGLAIARGDGEWTILFDGTSLGAWVPVGDGLWSITAEGYLLGQRDPRKPPYEEPWFNDLKSKLNRSWLNTNFKVVMDQAWLYTRQEFSEYELHLEWWVPDGGNSGVSLCDITRARYAFGEESDSHRTPSKSGYEIQINNNYADDHPSGSIYLVQKANTGLQRPDGWNTFDIRFERDRIRVELNGQLAAEHPPLPERPTRGPVGLQLHDSGSVVMFRNIRIRPLPDGRNTD